MKFHNPDEQRHEYRDAYLAALDLEIPAAFQELCDIAKRYQSLLHYSDSKVFGPGFLNERFLSWQKDIFDNKPGLIFAHLTDDWSYCGINAKPISKSVRNVEEEFIRFIADWQTFVDKFYLIDGWLERHARIVLEFRYKFGDVIDGFSSTGVFDAIRTITGNPLQFSFPGMRLNTSEKAKTANARYKKAAKAAFNKYLDQHIEDTDTYFKKTLKLTQKTNPHKLNFVGWLVLWNTRTYTKAKIEAQVNKDRTDLNSAFSELENLGLPYRRELSRPKIES